jgi:hypothetical protein
MSPALRFREEMAGYVGFAGPQPGSGSSEAVPEIGYEFGRADGTELVLRLVVVVDDVDRFIAGPDRRAMLRGSLEFEELGGPFSIDRGQLQIMPARTDPNRGRMYYCLGVRGNSGEWLTVRGVKQLHGGRGRSVWKDATSLRTRVLYGEPRFDRTEDDVSVEEHRDTLATGILRITLPGFITTLCSFRPRARTRLGGGFAAARFLASVGGAFGDIYLPRRFNAGRPMPHADEPKTPDPDKPEPDVDRQPREYLRPRKGEPLLSIERITPPDRTAPKGPVLLIAGSSVGSSVFRPKGVNETLVDRLLREGYDVYLENWRGSLDRTPREYSLDEAAAIDHPKAVAEVAASSGSPEVKAIVHCLGSSGFMLALASGRLHTEDFRVTRVVSNAVSLHPIVPRAAEFMLRSTMPVFNRVLPYLDPQWAADEPLTDAPPPDQPGSPYPLPRLTPRPPLGRMLVGWSRLTHHECESDVCNFAQFMYGAGPSTLYEESRLSPETRRWMEGQFAWAPVRLYRQIGRSLLVGHLVPMRHWDPSMLRMDLFETGPSKVDTRITFITGTRNRCFSPASQLRTFEWFSAHQPDQGHQFKPLEGFGHLDVWIGQHQEPVHEVVLDGLAD